MAPWSVLMEKFVSSSKCCGVLLRYFLFICEHNLGVSKNVRSRLHVLKVGPSQCNVNTSNTNVVNSIGFFSVESSPWLSRNYFMSLLHNTCLGCTSYFEVLPLMRKSRAVDKSCNNYCVCGAEKRPQFPLNEHSLDHGQERFPSKSRTVSLGRSFGGERRVHEGNHAPVCAHCCLPCPRYLLIRFLLLRFI